MLIWGYGRVREELRTLGCPYVVADLGDDAVEAARDAGGLTVERAPRGAVGS